MDEQTLLDRLLDSSLSLAETRALEPLLRCALDTALDVCGAEFGYLGLLDEQGALAVRARRDCLGHDLDTPEDAVVQAMLAAAGELPAGAPGLEPRAVVSLPLRAGRRALGALYIENRAFKAPFGPRQQAFLTCFAAQAGLAIDNALAYQEMEARLAQRGAELAQEIENRRKLEAEVERLAAADSLTGLFNRRRFFELAEHELARAERYGRSLSIILLDVDHFKLVNDVFGRVVGDSVLAGVAKLLCAELRQCDILARYAGEEFVVLLPETDLPHASEAAERLRKAVARQEFKMSQGGVSTTISLGVACMLPESPSSLDRLLERVDQALLAAKQAGRNRVACA